DSYEELPVSVYYERYQTYLSYPAIVGRQGIIEQVQLSLTEEEEAKLEASANYIKKKFAETLSK
ncbi:L-lactate dehydrogenase, partial [Streptococcus pyogenes]